MPISGICYEWADHDQWKNVLGKIGVDINLQSYQAKYRYILFVDSIINIYAHVGSDKYICIYMYVLLFIWICKVISTY